MPPRTLSPNQLDKRAQIIDAAKLVLVRDGLAGCTTRAVADASPLTRSAIHYYFESAQEIVDAAMDAHLADFIAALGAAADGLADPVARFWATIDAYRTHFAEGRVLALLWFEYAIQSIARGEPGPSRRIDEAIRGMLFTRLSEAGVADAEVRAGALVAYMIGSTMRQLFADAALDTSHVEIAALSGLPAPR